MDSKADFSKAMSMAFTSSVPSVYKIHLISVPPSKRTLLPLCKKLSQKKNPIDSLTTSIGMRVEGHSSFITTTVEEESQVTPRGSHRSNSGRGPLFVLEIKG